MPRWAGRVGSVFWHVYSLVFSELLGSVVWRLTLIWGNSKSLFFQVFLLFLPLSSPDVPITHVNTFCGYPLGRSALILRSVQKQAVG